MSTKPILFNSEMVQAILGGKKTQVHRSIKHLDGLNVYRAEPAEDAYENLAEWDFSYGWSDENGMYDAIISIKAPCAVGDVLWVKETWAHGYIEHSDAEHSYESWFEPSPIGCDGYIGALSRFFYRADEKDYGEVGIKWRPSIHMPKEAARIFLKVEDVRAENSPQYSSRVNPWVWVIEFERCSKPEGWCD